MLSIEKPEINKLLLLIICIFLELNTKICKNCKKLDQNVPFVHCYFSLFLEKIHSQPYEKV